MELPKTEVKQIATQILSGMLANPHVYPMVSNELGKGVLEQDLIIVAIEMAESLITKVEKKNHNQEN